MKRFSLFMVLVAILIPDLSVHAFYNSATGRWLSRDPIEENGGANVYGFVNGDAVNWIDVRGLSAAPTKKCGIVPGSFIVEWSNPHLREYPGFPDKFSITWHIKFQAQFRTDSEYDARCCEFKQLVKWKRTIIRNGETIFDNPPEAEDHYNRGDNADDAGRGYSDTKYSQTDDPAHHVQTGDRVDLSWTGTQIIYSPGQSWWKYDKKKLSPCECEEDAEVAKLSHTVHVTGVVPTLNWNGTIPKTISQ